MVNSCTSLNRKNYQLRRKKFLSIICPKMQGVLQAFENVTAIIKGVLYTLKQVCQTRGPRDDSKILDEFRQYCNVASLNKCLIP